MKKFRKPLIIILSIILALALIWVGGRYGWRLLGFRACGGSGVEVISVTDTQAELRGFYPGSFPSGCVGTITRQEGDTLYLGVRYSPIFGIFETGSFETTVALKEPIHAIILKAGSEDYLIWDAMEEAQ